MRKALFLLVPLFLFATSYNGEIITWGYGELLKNILEAIRALVDNNGLGAIFKAAVGIAFLLFTFKKATDGRANIAWEFGKMMTLAVAMWYLFLTAPNDAKHRYVITDRVTGANYVVEQVPTGIGEPLSLISNLEDKIANVMEREFSLPNSITYRNSGFGFPLQAQAVMPEIKSANPYFVRTFKEFLENCTLYEVQDGEKDIQEIITSNDLLAALDPNGDTRLTKVYSAANPDGEVMQCKDAYNTIKDEVQNKEVSNAEKLAAALMKTTVIKLEDRLPEVASLFFNASESARDYLQQNFLINMTKSSFQNIAAATGLSASQLAYSSAVAKQTANDKFITMGFLAKDYLPIVKGVLTAIIVGLSWIMALLAIMFMDVRYVTKYFLLLFWLLMWTPILVIINYIGDTYVAKVFNDIVNQTGQQLTLFTSSFVDNKTQSTLAWLGYLVWLTPMLAYSIVKASEYGFVSFASSLSSMASSGASAGASADVRNAQNPAPSIRVGDTTYTDMPGGGIKAERQFSYGGHSVDEKAVQMGNTKQLALSYDGGIVNAAANIGAGGISVNVDSKAASVISQSSLKSNLQKSIKDVKQQLSQSSENFVNTSSAVVSEAINSKDGFSLGTSKDLSVQQREAESKAVVNALEHLYGKDTQYASVLRAMKQASAEGGAGFKFKELAKGGIQITGTDTQGKQYSITLTGKDAQAFKDSFSKEFAKSLVQNESAREAFLKDTSHIDNRAYSELNSINKQFSESKSQLEAFEKARILVESKGYNISQNMLNTLAMDLISDYKRKNPSLSDEDAIKLATAEITDMVEKGTLSQELQRRGILDETVNKLAFDKEFKDKSNDIKITNTSNVDKINSIKENIQARGKNIDIAFGENYKSFNDLKQDYKNINIGTAPKSSIPDEVKDKEKEVNTRLNQSLLSNFWQDNASGIVGAGLLTAAQTAVEAKALYDAWKENRAITPEIINDDEPHSSKTSKVTAGEIEFKDAQKLPYKNVSMITSDVDVKSKNAVMALEGAEIVSKGNWFLNVSKVATGAGLGLIIEGTPLTPTPVADSSLYSGKFVGFAPQEHFFGLGSDTASIVLNSGGKNYALNTEVSYEELRSYMKSHPETNEILQKAMQNEITGSPSVFENITTPKELFDKLRLEVDGLNIQNQNTNYKNAKPSDLISY